MERKIGDEFEVKLRMKVVENDYAIYLVKNAVFKEKYVALACLMTHLVIVLIY